MTMHPIQNDTQNIHVYTINITVIHCRLLSSSGFVADKGPVRPANKNKLTKNCSPHAHEPYAHVLRVEHWANGRPLLVVAGPG